MSPQNAADHGCHYLPDIIAVRPGDSERAIAVLADSGVGAEDQTEFLYPQVDSNQAGVQDPAVGLLLLNGDDPHDAASILAYAGDPVEASPIHGVGYEGHIRMMSGDGPADLPNVSILGAGNADEDKIIAVVDSGIVIEDQRPDWMRDGNVLSESGDVEEIAEGASHGTFVTSILRRFAPDHIVSLAAAPPDTDIRLITSRAGGDEEPRPTNELDVLGAILRLVVRHGSDPSQVKALNLSLGASRCGDNDGFLLTIRAALDVWRRNFGREAPIFAAGGNTTDPAPVYPAAFDWVHGVAALGIDSTQVVWDPPNEVPAPPRSWISDAAPGSKIEGLSGLDETNAVWWSGSSFATAIATARSVTGAAFTVNNGVVVWEGF